jgi:hypothetical protein
MLTSLHHNKPVTREKLSDWKNANELTQTDDDKLEAMSTHKDTSAITILIYRNNNSSGLEIKDKTNKCYHPIDLNQDNLSPLKIAVILGREIQFLIPTLKGLSHRVIAQVIPESTVFARDVINCFVYHPTVDYRKLVKITRESSDFSSSKFKR